MPSQGDPGTFLQLMPSVLQAKARLVAIAAFEDARHAAATAATVTEPFWSKVTHKLPMENTLQLGLNMSQQNQKHNSRCKLEILTHMPHQPGKQEPSCGVCQNFQFAEAVVPLASLISNLILGLCASAGAWDSMTVGEPGTKSLRS